MPKLEGSIPPNCVGRAAPDAATSGNGSDAALSTLFPRMMASFESVLLESAFVYWLPALLIERVGARASSAITSRGRASRAAIKRKLRW